MGRRLGNLRRWASLAVVAAGAVLVGLAAYGVVGSGDVRHQLVAVCLALPSGLLALLAGWDLRSRSRTPSRSAWPVVSLDEWALRPESRARATRAASN